MNLWDRLFAAAGNPHARLWISTSSTPQMCSWREILEEAETIAGGLRERGIGSGDTVGVVLTNERFAVAGLLGIWLSGAVVASLPVPARGMDLAMYSNQLSKLARHFTAPFLLTDGRFAPMLDQGVEIDVLAWEQTLGVGRFGGDPPASDEVAFIQYSSGSTSMPKGCMLTTAAIGAQLALLRAMNEVATGDETVVSWLPLSHDMGLFGCLLYAWANSHTLVLSSPERFIQSPRTWFGDCGESEAAFTAGTNLALKLAARAGRHARSSKPIKIKLCVVGAERVEESALRSIIAAYGDAGLAEETLTPAYGLAEATLAVTATGARDKPQSIAVDAALLAEGVIQDSKPEDPASTILVSAGKPCAGVTVRTREPDRLSEICVRSPSLSSGYVNDPERTEARFCDGEVSTGDLGFIRDDQLFVVGRLDDIVHVGGRNVYAAEIESAMSGLDGVRTGCCVIVSTPRSTRSGLVALAEVGGDHVDFAELAAGMAHLATKTAGINLDECLFLAKGTLPKTPSGKIQRYRAHNLAADRNFKPLARVPLTA